MANAEYLLGRKKYSRPQAMLWSNNPGIIDVINEGTPQEEQFYVPDGYEVGVNTQGISDTSMLNQFIILSDDNRSPIDIKINRLEKRERMINGRMRSYHIADKTSITLSWTMLPSRSFTSLANFNATTGKPASSANDAQFTTDGGAGGVELLDWYETHKDPFWVYLAYDKHNAYGSNASAFQQLAKYNEVVEMYFADFSYSVVKRGASNFDFWNVSVTLEEV